MDEQGTYEARAEKEKRGGGYILIAFWRTKREGLRRAEAAQEVSLLLEDQSSTLGAPGT